MTTPHSERFHVDPFEACASEVQRQVEVISERIVRASERLTAAPPVRWRLVVPLGVAVVPLASVVALSVALAEPLVQTAATAARVFAIELLIGGWLLGWALWAGLRKPKPATAS